MTAQGALALVALLGGAGAACDSGPAGPVVIDLAAHLDADGVGTLTRRLTVDGERVVYVRTGARPLVLEAASPGAELVGPTGLIDGRDAGWRPPSLASDAEDGEVDDAVTLVVRGAGAITLSLWGRGAPPPAALRDRSLAWFDPALLDDPAAISFAHVLGALASDGHGGVLLHRWFTAFAAGPGAGRATFAQLLAELEIVRGSDPRTWDLTTLPFKITGIHNRIDLGRGASHPADCGELRVSIASTHPTFAPVHLLFLFSQPAADDDVSPAGVVHCAGTARRWAALSALTPAAFGAAARARLAEGLVGERFLLAESVELSLSPWQWRQWTLDGAGDLVTASKLFQTVDLARVNTPGPVRDQFLVAVEASAAAILARTWVVPEAFRTSTAEVQPNGAAPLPDLTPIAAEVPAGLPRALGMIGCPRCHTDAADFIQTSIDRRPSPFYDRELDARAAHLDALATGAVVPLPVFGPLQGL